MPSPTAGRDGVRWFATRYRSGNSTTVHAATKVACAFGARDEQEAAHVEAQDANSDLFTGRAYTIRSLCGAREVVPSGVAFDPLVQGACVRCSRLFAARSAPDIDGWLVRCEGCREELPVNRFGIDRRRRSGLAGSCTECVRSVSRDRRRAREAGRQRAGREFRAAEAAVRAAGFAADLAAMQADPCWPTAVCPDLPAHGPLSAGVTSDAGSWPAVVFRCDVCGGGWSPSSELVGVAVGRATLGPVEGNLVRSVRAG